MSQQDLNRVPGLDHYSLKYLRGDQIFSYAHQINIAISIETETVLEVGSGVDLVATALRVADVEIHIPQSHKEAV